MKTFGERVRERRLELKMTVKDLAFFMGIEKQHGSISNIELGKRMPNILLAQEIAVALETDLNVLLGVDTRRKKSKVKK